MVVTGASRSVAVKLFYDLGFRNPLFVTILYLTGQGLSLIVYLVSRRSSPSPARRRPRYKKVTIELPTRNVVPNPMHADAECPGEMEDEVKAPVVEEKSSETPQRRRSGSPTGLTHRVPQRGDVDERAPAHRGVAEVEEARHRRFEVPRDRVDPGHRRRVVRLDSQTRG